MSDVRLPSHGGSVLKMTRDLASLRLLLTGTEPPGTQAIPTTSEDAPMLCRMAGAKRGLPDAPFINTVPQNDNLRNETVTAPPVPSCLESVWTTFWNRNSFSPARSRPECASRRRTDVEAMSRRLPALCLSNYYSARETRSNNGDGSISK